MEIKPRYELRVFDDNTEEEIFYGEYYLESSLQEDLHNVDKAIELYVDETTEVDDEE